MDINGITVSSNEWTQKDLEQGLTKISCIFYVSLILSSLGFWHFPSYILGSSCAQPCKILNTYHFKWEHILFLLALTLCLDHSSCPQETCVPPRRFCSMLQCTRDHTMDLTTDSAVAKPLMCVPVLFSYTIHSYLIHLWFANTCAEAVSWMSEFR